MVGLDVGFIPLTNVCSFQPVQQPARAVEEPDKVKSDDASMEYGMGQNLGVPWWISKYIEIADEWLFIPQKNIVS